jgi:hypothetical protein
MWLVKVLMVALFPAAIYAAYAATDPGQMDLRGEFRKPPAPSQVLPSTVLTPTPTTQETTQSATEQRGQPNYIDDITQVLDTLHN